nr:MAG TPA: hypothetical protein [Caudoviricetes sp.]
MCSYSICSSFCHIINLSLLPLLNLLFIFN